MKSSKLELRRIIEQYADEELTDFLEYEINKNDINGIVENAINDIKERIREYIEMISKEKMKGKCKMIKTLEDITELEVVVTDMTHEEVLTKYWGEQAFSSMLGDDEDIDNSLMYAVYNDEID